MGAGARRGGAGLGVPMGAAKAIAQEKLGPPEKKDLKVGFIPITCATPIIMAEPMGFYEKHGLNVQVVKASGWAMIRDLSINKGPTPPTCSRRCLSPSAWAWLAAGPVRDAGVQVILPAAAPAILAGLRISIGSAWVAIVAAEMLIGGTGVGYFVWNEWNNLALNSVLFAILAIGLVGVLLDMALGRVARLVAYTE